MMSSNLKKCEHVKNVSWNGDVLYFEFMTYTVRMEKSKETDDNLFIHVFDTENMNDGGDWTDRLIIEKGRI